MRYHCILFKQNDQAYNMMNIFQVALCDNLAVETEMRLMEEDLEVAVVTVAVLVADVEVDEAEVSENL